MAELRGFNSTEEMDEEIISRYNELVTKRDSVYILGDVCWVAKAIPFLGRLNGHKSIVLGNHDQRFYLKYLDYVSRVEGVITKSIGGLSAVLTHVPIHPDELIRWSVNIHGHLHSNEIMLVGVSHGRHADPRYFNVSVERWNFYPVHRDTIADHYWRFI
jgi:calcineurin-like phosphoesterase family protein